MFLNSPRNEKQLCWLHKDNVLFHIIFWSQSNFMGNWQTSPRGDSSTTLDMCNMWACVIPRNKIGKHILEIACDSKRYVISSLSRGARLLLLASLLAPTNLCWGGLASDSPLATAESFSPLAKMRTTRSELQQQDVGKTNAVTAFRGNRSHIQRRAGAHTASCVSPCSLPEHSFMCLLKSVKSIHYGPLAKPDWLKQPLLGSFRHSQCINKCFCVTSITIS